jgi:hypothetical protein
MRGWTVQPDFRYVWNPCGRSIEQVSVPPGSTLLHGPGVIDGRSMVEQRHGDMDRTEAGGHE